MLCRLPKSDKIFGLHFGCTKSSIFDDDQSRLPIHSATSKSLIFEKSHQYFSSEEVNNGLFGVWPLYYINATDNGFLTKSKRSQNFHLVNCGGMSLKLLGLIAPPYPSVAFDSSSEMGTYQTTYLRHSYNNYVGCGDGRQRKDIPFPLKH